MIKLVRLDYRLLHGQVVFSCKHHQWSAILRSYNEHTEWRSVPKGNSRHL